MHITSIQSFPLTIPLKPAYRMVSALGSHEESSYVLVRLTTDEGIDGAGEATVMPRWSGETVWSARAIIDHVFGPAVIGLDPCDIDAVDRAMDLRARHNWFAKAAIEMACWDIRGKAEGKPVYELLGGPARSREVKCRFSLGAYPPDRAKSRAAELVTMGFDTIKVKVGGPPADDVARVRAVREAIGDEREIVIDANCGWDAETAIAAVNEMADCRIALVEQPTPDGDYAGMARVRREIDPPVMADDICFNLAHARELLRSECCDVISVYPGKQGGIRKAKEIVELAASHNVACSIGSNLEWDVATAAMGHLVVGCGNMRVEDVPGDMLGPTYHARRIVREPIPIEGPLVTVPDGPGLGVEVDWGEVGVQPSG